MNTALWVAQGLLAFAFIAVGSMKVFAYQKFKAMTEKKGPSGIPHNLATFIGIVEMTGGFGIIVPMAMGVAPWLSPLAAAGLATVMLLAIGFHVRRHESPGPTVVLFLIAAFVAVGRFSHWG